MKLIKLSEEHYVLTDDSEIKEGDWVVSGTKTIVQCMYPENVHHEDIKKITHSTQPLEWFGGEIIFLSEVKELVGAVDVEKRAEEKIPNLPYKNYVKIGFIGGYNQALEDNKDRKYTKEDVRVAIRLATTSKYDHRLEFYSEEEIIQSLQPQTEWEVEFIDGKLKLKQ